MPADGKGQAVAGVVVARLGRHHQHRQLGQRSIGTNVFQHVEAIHVRHVPVGHDEVEIARAQLGEAIGTVFRFLDVGITQFLEQIAHDATHR